MKTTFFRVLLVLVCVLVVFAGIMAVGLSYALSPIDTHNATPVQVVVPKGSGVLSIGLLLQKKELIRNPFLFRLMVWKLGIANSIQAGTFSLNRTMSMSDIAMQLTKGTEDVWVTIPEGWRNEEVADELAKNLGSGFNKQEFLSLAKDKQGYLFPETYLLPKEASASLVVATMEKTFYKKVIEKLAMKNVVTLASIVEREAKKPEDMRIVAGILLHRIELGWPLQVDATLQYIKGYDAKEKTWWPQPYAADKQLKSPYNTYAHTGLPPGPIANPGFAAIQAAGAPTETEYLFYLTDNNGVMRYAKTVEEHNANVRTYLR